MARITLQGNSISTCGELPGLGETAPDFSLCAGDLSEKSLNDFGNTVKILNIVPSLDTGICATSTRRFNEEAATLPGATVLVISSDLPFAQGRFCETEGLKNVTTLSTFRSTMPQTYGVEIIDGPLRGIVSRAVVVLDADNVVRYTEQVSEIAQEPNYEEALRAAKKLISS